MPCNCENARPGIRANQLHISSSLRPIRLPTSNGKFLTIKFVNDPGVFDGQFLKTYVTVNEYSSNSEPSKQSSPRSLICFRCLLAINWCCTWLQLDEKRTPRILAIQWKQVACIESGAQISKTFIPLKSLDGMPSESAPMENERFVVLEPVDHMKNIGLPGGELIRTGRAEISFLHLNCHYSLSISPDKKPNLRERTPQTPIPIGCLCTPACFDDQSVPWASYFSCTNKGEWSNAFILVRAGILVQNNRSLPLRVVFAMSMLNHCYSVAEPNSIFPPTDLRHELVSHKTIVYNISWKSPVQLRPPGNARSERSVELNPSNIYYR